MNALLSAGALEVILYAAFSKTLFWVVLYLVYMHR